MGIKEDIASSLSLTESKICFFITTTAKITLCSFMIAPWNFMILPQLNGLPSFEIEVLRLT
jgi:hypothetical protein